MGIVWDATITGICKCSGLTLQADCQLGLCKSIYHLGRGFAPTLTKGSVLEPAGDMPQIQLCQPIISGAVPDISVYGTDTVELEASFV